MNWWNRFSSVRKLVLGALVLSFIVVGYLRLTESKIGNKFCTMIGVLPDREGVVVKLVGHNLPEKYSVEVEFPSGTEIVECDDSHQCSDGAYLRQPESGYPAEKLTVTVIINNRRITKTFTPDYQITAPNGEGCEPVYYNTEIDFPITP